MTPSPPSSFHQSGDVGSPAAEASEHLVLFSLVCLCASTHSGTISQLCRGSHDIRTPSSKYLTLENMQVNIISNHYHEIPKAFSSLTLNQR